MSRAPIRAEESAALLGRVRRLGRAMCGLPVYDEAVQPRGRWQHVWLAVQQGVTLPPISVVQIGDAYAIRALVSPQEWEARR